MTDLASGMRDNPDRDISEKRVSINAIIITMHTQYAMQNLIEVAQGKFDNEINSCRWKE